MIHFAGNRNDSSGAALGADENLQFVRFRRARARAPKAAHLLQNLDVISLISNRSNIHGGSLCYSYLFSAPPRGRRMVSTSRSFLSF